MGASAGDDWIGEHVSATRTALQAPSVTAAVLRDGEIVDFRASGVLDLEAKTEPTPATLFRIGSVSKLFTAIAVMQLAEEGLLGIDDEVNAHLKSFKLSHAPGTGTPVTIGHLLSHTGAITTTIPVIGVADGEPIPSLADFFGPELAVVAEPGQRYEYSNAGFSTLGQLIADVSGLSFEDYMVHNVFDVLGMRHTDFVRSARTTGEIAKPYSSERGVLSPIPFFDIIVRPAGSVFSTATDMARFADAVCKGGANSFGRVLAPDTLAMMCEPVMEMVADGPSMGLAFVIFDRKGRKVVWHNGGWPGAKAELAICPDKNVSVFMATNILSSNGSTFDEASFALLEHVIAER